MNGDSIRTSTSYCGNGDVVCSECGTTETPRNACYRVCAARGNSASTCKSYCG